MKKGRKNFKKKGEKQNRGKRVMKEKEDGWVGGKEEEKEES